MLIPLMARAWGRRWHLDGGLADQSAEQVLSRLGWQGRAWMPDPVTLGLILWRTRHLVLGATHHFKCHPSAWGVNLGAGLSDYFQWLNNGSNHWVDADLACVMRLRSRCMPRHRHAMDMAVDLCADNWWAQMTALIPSSRQPMWIMLEGVLIYLQPDQVRQVLKSLGGRAPKGSTVAFDVIPRWMVGWPIRTPWSGTPPAVLQWGIESMADLTSIHPRLHLQEVTSSPTLTGGWPWQEASGWNPYSPYALVRLSVS